MPDFIRWSTPHLALTLDQMLRREPEGNWSYGYFSLIDPNAKDPNFSTITDHPYLYSVRMDGNHPPYQRACCSARRSSWTGSSRRLQQRPGHSAMLPLCALPRSPAPPPRQATRGFARGGGVQR